MPMPMPMHMPDYILHLANVSKAKPKAKPNLAIKINNVTSPNYALAMLGFKGIQLPSLDLPGTVRNHHNDKGVYLASEHRWRESLAAGRQAVDLVLTIHWPRSGWR